MPSKNTIESAILRHLAQIGPGQDVTIFYGDMAKILGDKRNLSGSKRQLDSISRAYRAANPASLLDITWILKSRETDYPSQIDDKRIHGRSDLTLTDKAKARAGLQIVINRFCKGAHNPY